ncbi:MAG TPA: GAF domain-containing sensor histidine kinase [Cryptosporangiaceae bacterium]|nr:GAF domain-containing sensor histidine kinase [Cryptosporangiaceae bacterium]
MTDDLPALRRLLDVTLALGAERSTEAAMRTVLEAARDLTDARYAAIGVPDGDGGFALFLTSGVDAETWDLIGALPRTHGILGALLCDPEPIRLADITQDPRFGWYPRHHPTMRTFLGVPIVAGGEILAELYLAEKAGDLPFTEADQRLMEMLAAHAALAVVNARLHERGRELSIVSERTRIARDLHDSVTQTLFSLTLVAESAATLAAGGAPPSGGASSGGAADARLVTQLDQVRGLSRTALEEMRELVDTLRGSDVEREGLDVALRKRVDLLRAVHDVPIDLDIRGPLPRAAPAQAREVLKIANEALANALQHAGASQIQVSVAAENGWLRLGVTDDGAGFDLVETVRHSRRLGLVSMRERAEALGGNLRFDTAPGSGTRVTCEVPLGR